MKMDEFINDASRLNQDEEQRKVGEYFLKYWLKCYFNKGFQEKI